MNIYLKTFQLQKITISNYKGPLFALKIINQALFLNKKFWCQKYTFLP